MVPTYRIEKIEGVWHAFYKGKPIGTFGKRKDALEALSTVAWWKY